MSKNFHRLVFFLITANQISAQEKSNFEKIYQKTFDVTSQKNMPQALKVADSLYTSSKDPLDKVKTLMLSANLYQQIGNFKNSIFYAEKANSLINTIDNADWQSQVTGFLATQYRTVGLYEKSKKYTSKSLETAKKIQDSNQYNKTLGLLHQEMGYYELDHGNFKKAIGFIEHSLIYFKQTKNSDVAFITANSYELLGEIYFKINDLKNSEINYRISEKMLIEPTYLLGFVYSGLGAIRIKEKNWKEADVYLKKAEEIADTSSHLGLKKSVYATINDYYEGINDEDHAEMYARKYLKAFSEFNAKNNEVFNEETEPEINKKGSTISVAKNVTILVLCSALIGLFVSFRAKQKRQRAKFRDIIRNQQKLIIQNTEIPVEDDEPDFSHISVEEISEKNSDINKKRNESLMTSETESKLLEFLNDFEKGVLYNNKNMSLPFLAGELNTNTKYLSYVINQHKSADFKTYINRLRINYIVDKLINDDKYRQYKISILADECGFSSHSKFASVFKIVTDYSPSAYIKLLESENQSDKISRFRENS
ncbi:AraC-like DNA-binding protein [Chryseobacterium ginsenosidimutans]|uniref:helix-turn-helix domain-containing protein n=1 Tax=Chryseobacterium ginsenosidimutans TaxID=687846 RepID=UPI002166F49C|nr:helix-turn-helix domain-containing protein [Chryseobacterium ginsenosidimutans]MCS3870715.1 AraC-like DNA-binding protein [Chryseobacterium ginsenosidimutans]